MIRVHQHFKFISLKRVISQLLMSERTFQTRELLFVLVSFRSMIILGYYCSFLREFLYVNRINLVFKACEELVSLTSSPIIWKQIDFSGLWIFMYESRVTCHRDAMQYYLDTSFVLLFNMNSYVKCYLLPDKSKASKKKTKVRYKTINPEWNEIVEVELFYVDFDLEIVDL